MILPGFPRPMPMAGGAVAEPFDISGSWETGNDGWDIGTAVRRDSNARTGSWALWSYLQTTSGGGNSICIYTIPQAMAEGLMISASVWYRSESSSGPFDKSISMYDSIGQLGYLQTSNTSTTYAQLSIDASRVAVGDVYVYLFGWSNNGPNNRTIFDDWRIQGVKP